MLGASYTGLAAARQLSILHPQSRIILLEGQNAGEGSSARNSGFLVDSILNEGHYSASNLEEYRKKYDIKNDFIKNNPIFSSGKFYDRNSTG